MDVERKVWILARPLSLAFWFSALVDTSNERFHLCHWAVLLTTNDLTITDIKYTMLTDATDASLVQEPLGTLFELQREGAINTVNVSSSFSLQPQWSIMSVAFVGVTFKRDADISEAGTFLKFPC